MVPTELWAQIYSVNVNLYIRDCAKRKMCHVSFVYLLFIHMKDFKQKDVSKPRMYSNSALVK